MNITERAVLAGFLFVAGCAAAKIEAPAGFASYEGTKPFRAVSTDGVVYRVRTEPNEPVADLPFWKEALKRRMTDAGYHLVAEEDISAAGQPGYLLELDAPQGTQDYAYLVAIFVKSTRLVIIESAGEVARFRAHRTAVVDAIQKITLASVN